MSRQYFDRSYEELEDVVDKVKYEFDNYLTEIREEIYSLIIDIQQGRMTDIDDINDELKEIRDRIEV